MRECGCLSTTTLAQPRRLCRPRHLYAVPRTFLQCVCIRRRNCIGQLSPFWEYAPAARQINPNASSSDSQSSLHSGGDRAEAVLELSTGRAAGVWRVDPSPNDPGLLAAKGGAAGGGGVLIRTLGRIFPTQS